MLSKEPYFGLEAPKSTGTDYFNPNWLNQFLLPDHSPADVQATLLELTTESIARGLEQLNTPPQECYVCGGGALNEFLFERLRKALPDSSIDNTGALGVDPKYVEAFAFAWLAQQRINHKVGNLPSVTQAKTKAVLGGIYAGIDDI